MNIVNIYVIHILAVLEVRQTRLLFVCENYETIYHDTYDVPIPDSFHGLV